MAGKTKSQLVKVDADTAPPAIPKIQYRDQIQVDHHLFKGEVAIAMKSDKFGPIKVKSIEHVHHFHSVNSQGAPQKQCHDVCGHRHEWKHYVDKEGNLVAECGPPIKKVTRQRGNNMPVTTYEPVKVFDPDYNGGQGRWITDNHVHEMTYLGSDVVSKAKIRRIQESNAAAIGHVGVQVFDDPKVPEGFTVASTDSKNTVD